MRSKYKLHWETTWENVERQLKTTPIENFRSDPVIVQRISTTRPEERSKWLNRCQQAGIPPEIFKDSLIGNPSKKQIGTHKKGNISFTGDSCRHSKTVHYIKSVYTPKTKIKVLEVGSGYGSFVEHMFRQFDISEYYIIDHPVMQRLQKYYLGEVGVLDKCFFYSSEDKVYDLPKVDLIVSVNSLSEMVQSIVTKYVILFTATLKPEVGRMYLQQRTRANGPHLHTNWNSYGFPTIWELDEIKGFMGVGNEDWVTCLGKLTIT